MNRRWMGLAGALCLLWSGIVSAAPVDDAIGKAKALFDAGKHQDAAVAYKAILSDFRDALKNQGDLSAAVWQGFGESLVKIGKKDQAQQAFARALAHRAKGKPAATAAAPAGDPASTGTSATTAVSKAGNTAGVAIPEPKSSNQYKLEGLKDPAAQDHYRRGAAYLEEKLPLYAIIEFKKALEVEPAHIELMEISGVTMADYGETYYDEAKALLVKVRAARKDENLKFEVWVALGRAAAHEKKPDYKLAEDALGKALKLNAKSYSATLSMGEVFLAKGEYKKAIEWFEKARKLEGADQRVLWGLGDANTELKEFHKALGFYSEAFDQNPELAEAAFKNGVGLKNVGREDDAIRFHELAISLDPTKARYHLGLVAIYLPKIMDFSARKHIDQALALEPENPLAHYYQGLFLEMRRAVDEAIPEYQIAAAAGSDMIKAKYQLANIYAAVGNVFPGNNFSADNPDDKLVYLYYKDYKRAYNLYKEVLTINPHFEHAAQIKPVLEKIEEMIGVERQLSQEINLLVK